MTNFTREAILNILKVPEKPYVYGILIDIRKLTQMCQCSSMALHL